MNGIVKGDVLEAIDELEHVISGDFGVLFL